MPIVMAGTDASHATVAVLICTRVPGCIHVTPGVSTAPRVYISTRVSGIVHCNAAFRGRLSRVNRITTVFSVLGLPFRICIAPLYTTLTSGG